MHHDETTDLFKLGTPFGVINRLYSRNEFTVPQQRQLEEKDIDLAELPLRTIVIRQFGESSSVIKTCHCNTKCKTERCSCKKITVFVTLLVIKRGLENVKISNKIKKSLILQIY